MFAHISTTLNTFWLYQRKIQSFIVGKPHDAASPKQIELLKTFNINPDLVINRKDASRKIEDAILQRKAQPQNKTNELQKQPQTKQTPPTLSKAQPSVELATEAQRKRLLQLSVSTPSDMTKETASLLINLAQERVDMQKELESIHKVIGKAVGDQWSRTK